MIKEWVVVDLKSNGEFKIAGHHAVTGQLHSSDKIVLVSNLRNLASDGVETFILLGPIAWELYGFHCPGAEINPSAVLKLVFLDRLPENERKNG